MTRKWQQWIDDYKVSGLTLAPSNVWMDPLFGNARAVLAEALFDETPEPPVNGPASGRTRGLGFGVGRGILRGFGRA